MRITEGRRRWVKIELYKKFNRIYEKHQKIDFDFLNKVYESIKQNSKELERSIKTSEVSKIIGAPLEKVNRYLSKYLVPFHYLSIKKGDKSRAFFSEEKIDGSYQNPSKEDVKSTIKYWFKDLISFFKKNSFLLNKNNKEEFRQIVVTAESERPDLKSYNLLVDSLWKRKIDSFVKLSWRYSANRYS